MSLIAAEITAAGVTAAEVTAAGEAQAPGDPDDAIPLGASAGGLGGDVVDGEVDVAMQPPEARLLPVLLGEGRRVDAVQDARRFVVGGNAAGEEAGFFSAGLLEWTSGANAGTTATVRAFYAQSGQRVIDLWNTPEAAIELGDGFRVYAVGARPVAPDPGHAGIWVR